MKKIPKLDTSPDATAEGTAPLSVDIDTRKAIAEAVSRPRKPKRVEKEDSGGAMPVLISKPENVVFHWLQPHELERLMKIEKPFSLAVASATTGYALGMIPALQSSLLTLKFLSKASEADLIWAIVYFSLTFLSVGISIVTWLDAFRGESDAKKLLKEIKDRPMKSHNG